MAYRKRNTIISLWFGRGGGCGGRGVLIFFGTETVIENITLFPDKKPFSPISSCSLHWGQNIRLALALPGQIPSKFPNIFYSEERGMGRQRDGKGGEKAEGKRIGGEGERNEGKAGGNGGKGTRRE